MSEESEFSEDDNLLVNNITDLRDESHRTNLVIVIDHQQEIKHKQISKIVKRIVIFLIVSPFVMLFYKREFAFKKQDTFEEEKAKDYHFKVHSKYFKQLNRPYLNGQEANVNFDYITYYKRINVWNILSRLNWNHWELELEKMN